MREDAERKKKEDQENALTQEIAGVSAQANKLAEQEAKLAEKEKQLKEMAESITSQKAQ